MALIPLGDENSNSSSAVNGIGSNDQEDLGKVSGCGELAGWSEFNGHRHPR
jgi:hypothetical protein